MQNVWLSLLCKIISETRLAHDSNFDEKFMLSSLSNAQLSSIVGEKNNGSFGHNAVANMSLNDIIYMDVPKNLYIQQIILIL